MQLATTAILILSMFAAEHAFGADTPNSFDPAETRCGLDDEGLEEQRKNILDYADQSLPNIPPEEDRYLTAESSAALKIYRDEVTEKSSNEQSNQRYYALQARPLYYVWKVRKELVAAREAMINVVNPKPYLHAYKNAEAEKLERAARAIYPVSMYAISMQEFLTHWQLTHRPILSSEQYPRLYHGLTLITMELAQYQICKLAKVMGRQPLY